MNPVEAGDWNLAGRLAEFAANAPPGVTGQEKAAIREAARRLRQHPTPEPGDEKIVVEGEIGMIHWPSPTAPIQFTLESHGCHRLALSSGDSVRLVRHHTEPDTEPREHTVKTGAERIAAERRRQMEEEGWDSDHDDSHHGGELALAAAAYAAAPQRLYQKVERRDVVSFRDAWPWEPGWDKRDKHGEIRRLEIAGALIAAEIDRLLRAVYTKTAEVEDD